MTSATIGSWSFKLGTPASPEVLTRLGETFNVSNVGVTNNLEDVTNFDSTAGTREYIAGLADGDEISVECNYIADNASQIVAMFAVDSQHTRTFELRYTGSSPEDVWSGSVVCLAYSIVPSATSRNTLSFTFKITGALTRS